MKPHLTATLVTAFAVTAWMPVSAAGQTRSDAALLVKVVDYFGETYTAKPNDVSTYVFFPGDTIRLRIEVANRGSEAITLMTRAPGPAQSLTFDAPPGVRVSIGSSVTVQRLGGEVPGAWSAQMLLDRNEALVFDAQVLVDSPMPRAYVVNFRTDLRDAAGRPVAPQAPRVQFEMRASEGAAAEQARRQASRAIVAGDDAAARQWIAALLTANPQSFAAHVLSARIAERNNDVRQATQSYERALSILDSDADTEYLRWVTDRRTVQNRADDLRALLRKRTQ